MFDYQKKAVELILQRSSLCLCFATGNGKSLVAVTATQELLQRHACLEIVVIAPLSLISNFKTSLSRYGVSRDHPAYTYYTYEGFAKAYKRNDHMVDGKVVIFDEVHHMRTSVYDALKRKVDSSRSYTPHEKRSIQMALKQASHMESCDPIMYVKSQTGGLDITEYAPRSLLAINGAKRAFKVICLTATPFFNSPCDIANVVAMLRREDVYSRSFFNSLLKDPDAFRNHVKGLFMFKDVAHDDPDFPKVVKHEVNLCMTPEYYQAYHEIEMGVAEKTRETNLQNPWVFMSGLRRATLTLKDAVKPRFALDIILQGQPTIVFSVFKSQGIRMVANYLHELGIRYAEISGDVSEEERARHVDQFNRGANKVILITSAGGEGLDFRGVRNIVCMEFEWNEAQLTQIYGRGPRRKSHAHLPVEERVVHIYQLCLTKPPRDQLAEHDDIYESADQLLLRHTRQKILNIQPILDLLKSCS